jgi:hypothetical protein
MNRKEPKPAALAGRLSRILTDKKIAKPIEIAEISDGPKYTAAYIAQLTGELALLANGAHFPTLAQLLARAQLEAELWSRQSN